MVRKDASRLPLNYSVEVDIVKILLYTFIEQNFHKLQITTQRTILSRIFELLAKCNVKFFYSSKFRFKNIFYRKYSSRCCELEKAIRISTFPFLKICLK